MNEATADIIKEDVDYLFGIFDHYLKVFPKGKIPGSNICELGPGKNLGMSLVFKCLGADQVHVADKYLKPFDPDYHPHFYKKLAEEFSQRYPDSNPDAIIKTSENGHEAAPLHIWQDDAEILLGIPNASIDFCGSWAVLEHLYCPAKAFARLGEVTKPGGLGLHQVDFRDHINFSRPLEFLLHHFRWNETPDLETMHWLAKRLNLEPDVVESGKRDANSLVRSNCGYYGNSFRHTDYNKLWLDNNFKILRFEANMLAEDEYMDDFIPRLKESRAPANALSRDELKIVSGCYLVKKQ